MKTITLLLLLLPATTIVRAQADTTRPFTFSGYAEMYYSYDFTRPDNHEKPNFIYNHKRHNEININLAYAKLAYQQKNIRGNLAFMVGSYAQYNLAAEPNWAQMVYEANIGVQLLQKLNVWLDAGILPSHIGFESAVGADCWNVTRSLLAENSPYYETGLRVSYTGKKEKFNMALLLLNGWQRVKKPDNIQSPSLGIQLNYKPGTKLTLNYSNFIGTDKPDSLNATRVFHNLYAIYQPTSKLGIIAGFDAGTDKYNNRNYGFWYSPVLIAQYRLNNRHKIAGRVEYYNDAKEIIVSTSLASGFKTTGYSVNYDFAVNKQLLLRGEVKQLRAENAIFNRSRNNFSTTFVMALKL